MAGGLEPGLKGGGTHLKARRKGRGEGGLELGLKAMRKEGGRAYRAGA